jgi:hypothetical protein
VQQRDLSLFIEYMNVMEKTGKITAVQHQLGQKNAAYSMQYSRITAGVRREVINDR